MPYTVHLKNGKSHKPYPTNLLLSISTIPSTNYHLEYQLQPPL